MSGKNLFVVVSSVGNLFIGGGGPTFITNKDKYIPADKHYFTILEKSKIINIIV